MNKENQDNSDLKVMIANAVYLRRICNKQSQDDLAKATGLSQAHIGRIENGKRTPSIPALGKIALGLGYKKVSTFLYHAETIHNNQNTRDAIKVLRNRGEFVALIDETFQILE